MNFRKKPTITDLLTLYTSGVIGRVEFRGWLAKLYKDYAEVRNTDVDKFLEKYAEEELAPPEE